MRTCDHLRSFDEAIQDAPVSPDWYEKATFWEVISQAARDLSEEELAKGVLFLAFWGAIAIAVLKA
jgi:hypothetical protein